MKCIFKEILRNIFIRLDTLFALSSLDINTKQLHILIEYFLPQFGVFSIFKSVGYLFIPYFFFKLLKLNTDNGLQISSYTNSYFVRDIDNDAYQNLHHIPYQPATPILTRGPKSRGLILVDIDCDTDFDMYCCVYYIFEIRKLVFMYTLKFDVPM